MSTHENKCEQHLRCVRKIAYRTRTAFDVRVKSGEYKRKMDWQMRKVLLVLALISLNSISN